MQRGPDLRRCWRGSPSSHLTPSLRGAPAEAQSDCQQPRQRPLPHLWAATSAPPPRGPAHPGSGSSAGTGLPAQGTFSSRPTTGAGRSHSETWLCWGWGGKGRPPRGVGRGREGGDRPINTRAAPAPCARRASLAPRLRGRQPRPRLLPRSGEAPGPQLASYSPQTTQNI